MFNFNNFSVSTNDPNFLYILGAQILLFIAVCVIGGWTTYQLIHKYRPNLNQAYKSILTVAIVITVICIIGYASEALGL